MKFSRIAEMRLGKFGCTQEVMAKKLGMTAACYRSYESGNVKLTAENAIRIAQVFRVTTDYLLGLSDSKRGIISGANNKELETALQTIQDLKRDKQRLNEQIFNLRLENNELRETPQPDVEALRIEIKSLRSDLAKSEARVEKLIDKL